MNNLDLKKISCLDAMRYYVCYKDIEEKILEDFTNSKIEIKIQALKSYMFYMKISRNFKSDSQLKIIEILNSQKKFDVNKLSNHFEAEGILSGQNKKALVAASKFIWLINKETIIMDNYNREILMTEEGNYNEYYEKWNENFNKRKIELERAIQELKKIIQDKILDEDWFKMRVFDLFLWTIKKQK